MIIASYLLSFLALVGLLPAALLLVQVLSACFCSRSAAPEPLHSSDIRIVVLIPAHDEAEGIAATLYGIQSQLRALDRVIVIADNCRDQTAEISRQSGAEVIVRTDDSNRGKGYALDFGVRHLAASPPDVVIVIDADCQISDGLVRRLGSACYASGVPRQALYLMHAPTGAGLKTRIAEFAWLLKNNVRPLGYQALGLPCHLNGTGMAFPWAVIEQASLASGNITEDMQLGIDLAAAGYPPRFDSHVKVSSMFPEAVSGLRIQRERWEHGHLETIMHTLPRVLWTAIKRYDWKLLFMAVDLAVPPLALFASLLGLTMAGSWVFTGFGGAAVALEISIIDTVLFSLAILITWLRWGRKVISMTELLTLPLYIISKLPIYVMFWTKRQTAWIRTPRK